MDYQIAGLPLHVLVVHVVVVGIPLLAVLLVVLGAWGAARRVLWLPTLIGAAVLLGFTVLAIEAGEWLQERVPETPLMEAHTDQGEDILPWMIGLVVVAALVAAVAILERRAARPAADAHAGDAPSATRRLTGNVAVTVLLVIAAVGVGVGAVWTIVQIGDSGARSVWEGSFSDQPLEGD